jgi:hypothetical protein
MVLGAILGYAQLRGWVRENAVGAVERKSVRYSGDYDLYSREEIDSLVRHSASEQDAAIFARRRHHQAPPRGTRCIALARCRLRGPGDPRPRQPRAMERSSPGVNSESRELVITA